MSGDALMIDYINVLLSSFRNSAETIFNDQSSQSNNNDNNDKLHKANLASVKCANIITSTYSYKIFIK